MKKKIYALLISLFALSLFAKEIIKNPPFIARNNDNLTVTQVELNDTATILTFQMKNYPKVGARIDRDNCIRPSAGGAPMHYKSTIGYQVNMEKNEFWMMPDSGKVNFSIVYPRLDSSVESIDFSESEIHDGNLWEIFGIQLKSHASTYKLPNTLEGSWLKADGTNLWAIGLYEHLAFYDNQSWQYERISLEGKSARFLLKNDSGAKELVVRQLNEKTIGVSESGQTEIFCQKEPTKKQVFDKQNNKGFTKLFYRNDSVTYAGYIKGYTANMPHEASVIYENIVSAKTVYYPVRINPDGTFRSRIPVYYPCNMAFSFLGNNTSFFLEPGKSLCQLIDLANGKNSYFMGSGALLNAEIIHSGIKEYGYTRRLGEIVDKGTLQQYADTVQYIYEKEKQQLALYQKGNSLSKKASHILNCRIQMNRSMALVDFNLYALHGYGYRQFVSGADGSASPFKNQKFTASIYETIGKAFRDSFSITSNHSLPVIRKIIENPPADTLDDQAKGALLFKSAFA